MEVCVDSVGSAVSAERGGASRLELCSALSEGGLTPSVGLLQRVKARTSLPVFAMVRPRRGLDFVYSEDDVEVMKRDVEVLDKYGADGFVFGALTPDFDVDAETCRTLMKSAGEAPVTFHRAFDEVNRPLEALEEVVRLGFSRILTSGQEDSAERGVHLVRRLREAAGDRIVVMPGAGITADNLRYILEETGAEEFHGSGKKAVELRVRRPGAASIEESTLLVTDPDAVRQMVQIYKDYRAVRTPT